MLTVFPTFCIDFEQIAATQLAKKSNGDELIIVLKGGNSMLLTPEQTVQFINYFKELQNGSTQGTIEERGEVADQQEGSDGSGSDSAA